MFKCALTGGSCTGKTTLIEALERAGYHCIPEASTQYRMRCLAAGKEHLSSHSAAYSTEVLKISLEQEDAIPSTADLVFYDRTCIDQVAFCRYFGHTITKELYEAADNLTLNLAFRPSFIKNPETGNILFENTFWRRGSLERAFVIQELVKEEYEKRGQVVIDLPQESVQNRIKQIMEAVKSYRAAPPQ